MRALAAAAALLVAAAPGCAGPARTAPDDGGAALTRALASLDGGVDPREAARVAHTALRRTEELARRYAMARPALLHNALVRTGLRERGLCCHWAEDLLDALEALETPSLRTYWVVAHHGSQLREHSAVAVAAAGSGYREGLVLDAWRRGGELYWAPLAGDRYPWTLHPLDGDRDRLQCRE